MPPTRPATLLLVCATHVLLPLPASATNAGAAHLQQQQGATGMHVMWAQAESMGAVCLDGSPGSFYYEAGASTSREWVLYFEGGGWCYTEEDCLERSNTALGTTVFSVDTSVWGVLSPNCILNPDFCTAHKVYLTSCDGTSFTGDREHPVEYGGKKLYFRGARIRAAVLETLVESFGLGDAERVLITGFSAGGTAVLLHTSQTAAYLKAHAPGLQDVRAAPMAGMFLDVPETTSGQHAWRQLMQYLYHMANMSAGLDARCFAERGMECMFPLVAYEYSTVPVFVMNSAVDSYMVVVLTENPVPSGFPNSLDIPLWGVADFQKSLKCSDNACTDSSNPTYAFYAQRFLAQVSGAAAYNKEGNGAMIFSCVNHGLPFATVLWGSVGANNVSIREALGEWWGGGERNYTVNIELGASSCPPAPESSATSDAMWYVAGAAAGLCAVLLVVATILCCRLRGSSPQVQDCSSGSHTVDHSPTASAVSEETLLLCGSRKSHL
eukprot:TRINITY_DN2108_c0_g1_i3.p1 TRINITY_DN2108_c0_g1~~TRINITY_DN2108_c0_g1_i3.p1  ORF type:complete len:495 (+),score=157.37 TRINITY_DN2108_c0_g1_i3:105-1589(+)